MSRNNWLLSDWSTLLFSICIAALIIALAVEVRGLREELQALTAKAAGRATSEFRAYRLGHELHKGDRIDWHGDDGFSFGSFNNSECSTLGKEFEHGLVFWKPEEGKEPFYYVQVDDAWENK